MKKNILVFSSLLTLILIVGCNVSTSESNFSNVFLDTDTSVPVKESRLDEITSEPIRKILKSALDQTRITTNYTQEYFVISYPGGDVPAETGACTDVVIRAMRAAGVDLQKEVHEDMRDNFSSYPTKWGLKKPDTNIDHRRVPNLQTFFTRKGKHLPIRGEDGDYQPGDIVSWDLNGKGMTHIGLISNERNEETGRYMIIHNIGAGTKLEDRLFDWEITGHFRYF